MKAFYFIFVFSSSNLDVQVDNNVIILGQFSKVCASIDFKSALKFLKLLILLLFRFLQCFLEPPEAYELYFILIIYIRNYLLQVLAFINLHTIRIIHVSQYSLLLIVAVSKPTQTSL